MKKFIVIRLALLKMRLESFGEVPICNGKRSRGILIGDFCFPLCTRCTSMMFFTLLFYLLTITKRIKRQKFIVNVLLLIPLVVDGVMQYGFGFESTNFRRALTGCFWGFGLGNLLGNIYTYIPEKKS